jgi:hypothetical protein
MEGQWPNGFSPPCLGTAAIQKQPQAVRNKHERPFVPRALATTSLLLIEKRLSWVAGPGGVQVLIGTELDDSGIRWALLAREQNGQLEFAGLAIIRPPSHARAEWTEKFTGWRSTGRLSIPRRASCRSKRWWVC